MHLLGLNPVIKEHDEKAIADFVKRLNPAMNWPKDWNALIAPRVGKNFSEISSEMRSLFSQEFEAETFSVLSYGNIDAVTQKVYAIIEKNTVAEQELFVIKKIYWL